MLAKSFTLSLACAALATAQSSAVPSLTASVAPAAETVAVDTTPANVPLFKAEVVQLTDNVVADIQNNPDLTKYASLFEFEDSKNSTLSDRARRVRRSYRCKTMPGDFLYPGQFVWGIFDLLLGGALEKIIPIGSVCYKQSEYNNYDAAKCAALVQGVEAESTYYKDNGALMNPLYYGMTCDIPNSGNYANGTCTQGGYSEYAVKVSNVAQIQLAVNFARSLNLRLVVRNTGHDYNGRSVGKGALSIWTHNLKTIQYIQQYSSPTYSGPVFKVGAGVQGFELYQAAEKYGVSAIAGICSTVGVFGGYSTGGGHSPLMQLFGLGADQVLALEVVLANGRFVTVTPSVNSDLYWAMLGGGGGTFGIITSAVVKVHRKVPVTTASWTLMTSPTVTPDKFWEAVKFFWDSFPAYNEAKTYSWFTLMRLAPGTYLWSMNPFFSTDKTVAETNALLKPFFDKCAELGIQLNANTTHYDSFYPAYDATWGKNNFHVGRAGATPGNRMLPTENWANEQIRGDTFAALRKAVDSALLLNGYHQHPADDQNKGLNSANPQFRKTQSMIVAVNSITDLTAAGWKAGLKQLTDNILGPLRQVTPTGGAYGNEADIGEPDWQNAFWGENYPRLLSIKQKYDPSMLFYVHHGVGTEGWRIEDNGIVGVQSTDGPLCRVSEW
ncbi:uncharacterized protein K460DRAFT_417601 [Cucurbitaria berberidis CBS 394.84]|uniref:FAD-binding PCMH-type domain-containing protein n=1 Tax=Cucurbitaria berberidis CBS 394.84 TaxID=1168544 RepID=A0A9P4GI12_9PLEO|nr:uncharacterized protein K460DRAFT_417601 [Cucurbitaria berberidis CBS 394.84]KAF1846543.1 hypothetical protein K460DRAFT_417601 [Cucurbitaria berberidis CBS 394.84]